jgi:nickel transport protein
MSSLREIILQKRCLTIKVRPLFLAVMPVLISFLFLSLCSNKLLAHAVYIFAYSNGDEICTDSYFSKKNRVIAGKISMLDADGKVLAEGITANDGSYCFPAPPGEGKLNFVVLAGEGHRAEFTLEASDRPKTVGTEANYPEEGTFSTGLATNNQTNENIKSTIESSIKTIVRDELKNQLNPINRKLAEASEAKPVKLKDIVGGLGWLVGITGIIFWSRGRNKKT